MLHKKFIGFFADLDRELKNLESLVAEAAENLQNLSGKPSKTIIRACAGILHDFYTGIEKIFERIANEIDGGVPRGYDWHLQLLQRMLAQVPDTRPQVIDASLGEELDEFMRFRHVFRHQYGFQLRWQLVKELINRLPQIHQRFVEQIRNFEQWLLTTDNEDKSPIEA
jgi:hypothetical protein